MSVIQRLQKSKEEGLCTAYNFSITIVQECLVKFVSVAINPRINKHKGQ